MTQPMTTIPAATPPPPISPSPTQANHLPERIRMLADVTQNLWWSWQLDARELFHRIDHLLWESTRHNAVEFLRQVAPDRLAERSRDPLFLERYDQVIKRYERLTQQNGNGTWFASRYPEL